MLQSVFSAFHKLIPPPFCEFGHEPFVRSGDFVRAVRVIPNRLAHTGETLRANLMDPSKHLPQKEFGASTRTSFFFSPGTSTMIQSSLSQQDLLFFVTLCRLQSLTVSAQKLNLSLSSACRMLTHLRETFGEPLFVRSRNGLMPTPGAMALLPKAIMLLDGFDDLFEPPVFDPAQAQRLIRIACADFGAVSILTKVIPAIIDKAPHLDFQILPIESDLVGKLSRGEIDFGIFPTEKTSPGIRSVLHSRVARTATSVRRGPSARGDLPRRKEAHRGGPRALAQHQRARSARERDRPAGSHRPSAPQPARPHAGPLGLHPASARAHCGDGPRGHHARSPDPRRAGRRASPISALSPIFSGMVHRPHLLWHERNDSDTLLRWVMALFVYVFHEEKEGPTFQYPTS